jgi:hypothetical protein
MSNQAPLFVTSSELHEAEGAITSKEDFKGTTGGWSRLTFKVQTGLQLANLFMPLYD